ncbi:hypothetical protein [Amycolatopsis australiensis]|uniref:Uncharacterized protein n=1 Tax=Amycolatopsis australiensis TaxID=546364 RepID=A0A1K1R9R1_9PSEU|nr:hypothetical protein [Amycolatopsis australiensis]SFW68871.1 hypothetical protein SAMN04489730_2922 [Amycolatopsis australiensis]
MNALTRIWHDGRRAERVAYAVGAALFLSGTVHAIVLIATGGSWLGPLSMRKAVTFGLSFGLTLASVAWATSFLTVRPRLRTGLLGAFTAASVVEVALVSMQVWRGVPSHFNFETPFDNAVSMTLAAGGGVIILTVIGFTAAALVEPGPEAASLRLAIRAGLVVLLVALATGAVMVGRGVAEARGGDPQLAYTTAGALKPLHAVAMHAILVLPALASVLRFTRWPEAHRLRVVRTAVVADAVLTAVIGVESFTGVDPLTAPLPVLALSVLALAGLAGTGLYALTGVEPAARFGRVPVGKARGR